MTVKDNACNDEKNFDFHDEGKSSLLRSGVCHRKKLAPIKFQASCCAWSAPVFFKVRHCEELATRQSRGVAGSGRQCAIDRMMLDGHASLAMTVKYIARHNGERDHSP
jgi:hypothetical protein